MENQELGSDPLELRATEGLTGEHKASPEVYLYIAVLSFFILIPGNIAYAPLQFLYQRQLHLDAHQTAVFKLVVNLPAIFGFAFGMIRDRVNPLGMGDRGLILLSALGVGALYGLMALIPLSIYTLGAALILMGCVSSLLGAGYSAIMRNMAEARLMTGRMSTLYNFMAAAVPGAFSFVGGVLIDHTIWRTQLGVVAGTYLLIALCGLWRPAPVVGGLPSGAERTFRQYAEAIKLLGKHRGYWVAVALWAIWNFAPAALTPMQFYLTKTLGMNGTQYGLYNLIFGWTAVPTMLLFGVLCKRVRLWPLLLVATVVAIPQWLPSMFIHTAAQVYAVAAFMGLVAGLATVAYWDLLLRACPGELAGAGMLLPTGLALLTIEAGNVLGGYIFDRSGFYGCAVVTTAAYALLLPLCFLIPRALVEPRDDEHVPTEEELVAA